MCASENDVTQSAAKWSYVSEEAQTAPKQQGDGGSDHTPTNLAEFIS